MSGSLARLLALNAGVFLLGLGVLPLLGIARTRRELAVRVGMAHFAGLAIVAILSTDLAIIGLPFSLPLFVALAAGALAGGWLRLRRSERAKATEAASSFRARTGWFLALAGAAALLVLFSAREQAFVVHPLAEWDGWAIWSLKAKALLDFGDAHNAVFTSPGYAASHLDYPLGLPGIEELDFRAIGSYQPTVAHVQLLLLAVSFAGALVSLLAGRTPVEIVIAALLVLMAAPSTLTQLETNYADVPLALFAGIGIAATARAILTGEAFAFTCAALFLGAAALTKNEGDAFAAATLVAAAAAALVFDRSRLRGLGFTALAVVAIAGSWRVWGEAHGGPIDYRLSYLADPHFLQAHSDRVQLAARTLWRELRSSWWGSVGTILAVGALCALLARRFALLLFAALFLLLAFGGLVAIYWVSVTDVGFLLAASAWRVVDTLVVGAVVLARVCAGECWRAVLDSE